MNEKDLDIIDLNDYILEFHPSVYEATKGLSSTEAVMRIWTIAWKESGCPEIREFRD